MRILLTSILFVVLVSCKSEYPQAIIYTSIGNIQLVLYQTKAPKTVSNFIAYADAELYDSTTFFRTCTPENEAEREIQIEVIQGGHVDETVALQPIQIETTQQTGILHKDGTISMARDTPNSAQSDFFICIGNQPSLDYNGARNPDGFGFAAFGKVIKGMKIVLAIQALENNEQMIIQPVVIDSVRIVK